MKKLISVLALAALVCGAAFADLAIDNWYAYTMPGSDANVTDYAPAGFDVTIPDQSGRFYFDFMTEDVSGWLYNSNEPFTVTFENFGSDDFDTSEGTMCIYLVDEREYNGVCYYVPWSGNGTYTITTADLMPSDGWGSLENTEVRTIEMTIRDSVHLVPGASGRVKFALGAPEEDPTPETELPEPCK